MIITTKIILSATLRQSSSISVYFRASRWLEKPFYRRTKWRNGRVAEGQPSRHGTEVQIHVGLKTGITILLAYLPLKLSSLEICWKKKKELSSLKKGTKLVCQIVSVLKWLYTVQCYTNARVHKFAIHIWRYCRIKLYSRLRWSFIILHVFFFRL